MWYFVDKKEIQFDLVLTHCWNSCVSWGSRECWLSRYKKSMENAGLSMPGVRGLRDQVTFLSLFTATFNILISFYFSMQHLALWGRIYLTMISWIQQLILAKKRNGHKFNSKSLGERLSRLSFNQCPTLGQNSETRWPCANVVMSTELIMNSAQKKKSWWGANW